MDILLLPDTFLDDIPLVSSMSTGRIGPVIKNGLPSSSEIASWRTFLLVYSQLSVSPLRMLSRVLIALLMLLALKSTIFPKDFLVLVFFMFSPNARP